MSLEEEEGVAMGAGGEGGGGGGERLAVALQESGKESIKL